MRVKDIYNSNLYTEGTVLCIGNKCFDICVDKAVKNGDDINIHEDIVRVPIHSQITKVA